MSFQYNTLEYYYGGNYGILYEVILLADKLRYGEMLNMELEKFEYEGYEGTVSYDKKADYYTGEVKIDGRIYTYEGDTLDELREDFEDIIDSMIAFDEMDDGSEDETDDGPEDETRE